MRDYIDMFRKAVQAVRNDYVGYDRKRELDQPNYLMNRLAMDILEGCGPETCFTNSMDLYLAGLRDPGLELLVDSEPAGFARFSRGFSVREFEGALYVDETFGEERVAPGDLVFELEHLSYTTLLARYRTWIDRPDAQARPWNAVVKTAHEVGVRHADGSEEQLRMTRFAPLPERWPNEVEVAPGGAQVVLRLGDFDDVEGLWGVVEGAREAIARAQRLVIDLRTCTGDALEGLGAVVPYVIDRAVALGDYVPAAYTCRYTPRNSAYQIAQVRALRAQVGDDAAACRVLDELAAEYRAHRKDGYVLVEPDAAADGAEVDAEVFEPAACAAEVVVLIDVACRGAGELVARVANDCSRACTVGRATAGALEYFGFVELELDPGYTLRYPTCAYAQSAGFAQGEGVVPAMAVPWSPEAPTPQADLARLLSA